MTLQFSRAFLMASVCVGLSALPSWALDGRRFLTKLNAALEINNIAVLPDTMTVDGNDIRFSDAKIKSPDGKIIAIGPVEIDNVQEVDGGYLVSQISTNSFELSTDAKDTKIVVEQGSIEGFHIREVTDNKSISTTSYADYTSFNGFSVLTKGETIISSGFFEVKTTADEAAGSLSSKGFGKDIIVNLENLTPEPNARETLKQVNLDLLQGSVDFSSSLTFETGLLNVDLFKLDFKDLGSLSLNFGITGYTSEFLKKVNEANAKAPKQPTDGKVLTPNEQEEYNAQLSAHSLALAALFSQLSFNEAEIEFVNKGLAELALQLGAQSQSQSPQDMKSLLKFAVPMYLGQLGLGQHAQKVTTAVNAFIDNPQKISASFKPDAPLPFIAFIGIISDLPAFLDTVKFTISAND